MIKKLSLIIFIVILSLFFHYFNKHKILKYRREIGQLQENYGYIKAANAKLITDNNQLRCRGRIVRLAIDELGMTFPAEDARIHNIKFDPDRNTFCLIDYIIPSAEAITRE